MHSTGSPGRKKNETLYLAHSNKNKGIHCSKKVHSWQAIRYMVHLHAYLLESQCLKKKKKRPPFCINKVTPVNLFNLPT